jgi:uncharacterized protein (TIGR03435 family)
LGFIHWFGGWVLVLSGSVKVGVTNMSWNSRTLLESMRRAFSRSVNCALNLRSPVSQGITGAGLKEPVRRIVTRRMECRLTFSRRLFLAATAFGVAAAPIVFGQMAQTESAATSASRASGKNGSLSIGSSQTPDDRSQNSERDSGGFVVATIKPNPNEAKSSRYMTIQGMNRFVVKDYSLKLLIAAAYDMNPKTISGGPDWVDSDHYDILALTPGQVRPSHDQQMAMLQKLLADRFKLTFHHEQKEFSIYALEVAKDGPKLNTTTLTVDDPSSIGPGVVYPQKIVLPGHNATMHDLASLLQRAILDRPVVDMTGLAGRYDFSLEWAPDETQFGGAVPEPTDTSSPPLFEAIQQQLGLKLEARKGPASVIVIDQVEHPSPN